MQTVNVGLIGLGRIGKIHAENILYKLPHLKLQAVADFFLDKTWLDNKNIPVVTTDPNDIFVDENIAAVIICSPVDTHFDLIKQATKFNKAIFCEKPISLQVEETAEIVNLVTKTNTKLQIGFNRRYETNFRIVKQKMLQQDIGIPYLIRITSRDPGLPSEEYIASSGGIFYDMTIHDFDMLQYIMGSRVTEVFTVGGALINPAITKYNDIDSAVINVKFANGALGVIDNSREAVYGYDQRIEVFGSKACVRVNNVAQNANYYSGKDGITHSKPLYFFTERYCQAYLTELEDFYQYIIHGTEPIASYKDCLDSINLAKACTTSYLDNRVVDIKELCG